jgi:hypothetical protein
MHRNISFMWMELYDECFESIKALIVWTPILKPIDPNESDPIWVICNTSVRGISTFYGQGPEWYTTWPAEFLSRKFTPAQCSYYTWEHELIDILKALIKQVSGNTDSSPCIMSIWVHDLNKGRAGDLARRVSSAKPACRQAISDIYTRDHSKYHLLIVTLLA